MDFGSHGLPQIGVGGSSADPLATGNIAFHFQKQCYYVGFSTISQNGVFATAIKAKCLKSLAFLFRLCKEYMCSGCRGTVCVNTDWPDTPA